MRQRFDIPGYVDLVVLKLSPGVLFVLGVHLRAFCGVIEDACEVEHHVADASELLRSCSGHCVEVTSLQPLLAHSYFLHSFAYRFGKEPKHIAAAYVSPDQPGATVRSGTSDRWSYEEAKEVWIILPRQPISASNTHRCWTGVVSGECHRVQRSQSG
jgi:hypothetical protein